MRLAYVIASVIGFLVLAVAALSVAGTVGVLVGVVIWAVRRVNGW